MHIQSLVTIGCLLIIKGWKIESRPYLQNIIEKKMTKYELRNPASIWLHRMCKMSIDQK